MQVHGKVGAAIDRHLPRQLNAKIREQIDVAIKPPSQPTPLGKVDIGPLEAISGNKEGQGKATKPGSKTGESSIPEAVSPFAERKLFSSSRPAIFCFSPGASEGG